MKRFKTFGILPGEKKKIGVLRIAHSGVEGAMEEIENFLGPGFEVIEKGAMDPYSYEDIVKNFTSVTGGKVLTSELRTGETVIMDENEVYIEMQKTLNKFEEEGIKTVILFCTGFFTGLEFGGMLVEPGKLVKSCLTGLKIKNIGIIVPEKEQIFGSFMDYEEFIPIVEAASPYRGKEDIEKAAKKLGHLEEVSLIVLDCMGFDMEMREMVLQKSNKPVILPRMLCASLLKEIF
nr:AroM family protein [Oxobacter pfennigii]